MPVNYFDVDPLLPLRVRRGVAGAVVIGLIVAPGPTNRLVARQIDSYAHELAANVMRAIDGSLTHEHVPAKSASKPVVDG